MGKCMGGNEGEVALKGDKRNLNQNHIVFMSMEPFYGYKVLPWRREPAGFIKCFPEV